MERTWVWKGTMVLRGQGHKRDKGMEGTRTWKGQGRGGDTGMEGTWVWS